MDTSAGVDLAMTSAASGARLHVTLTRWDEDGVETVAKVELTEDQVRELRDSLTVWLDSPKQ